MSQSSSNSPKLTDEQIVNRWAFDFYVFKAFSAFRNGNYAAFTEFTDIIESLVVRPVDGNKEVIVKLRFMQFLSLVNNGDKLGITLTLESALNVLESICRDMSVPQKHHEHLHNSITEMLIKVCIKSGEFERAEEMLNKHFHRGMDFTAKRKLYVNLIRKRCCSHSVLQLSSYTEFKQDMLDFIERLYSVPQPFLSTMLQHSGGLCVVRSRDEVYSTPPEQTSPSKSTQHGSECSPSGPVQVSMLQLRLVYSTLSEQFGVSVPFCQLQQEVESEALEENRRVSNPELHLSLSETPREQSERLDVGEVMKQDGERSSTSSRYTGSTPSRYAGMTISRLVLEEDSQHSDDDITPQEESQVNMLHDTPAALTQTARIGSDGASVSEPQTDDSSPASVCRKHIRRRRIVSESESDLSDQLPEVQSSTPARHTRDPSPPPPVSCTITDKHQNRSRIASESEREQHSQVQSSTPARHMHDPSPASISRTRTDKQHKKRARWQEVSGTHEDWSDEESLFSVPPAPSSKERQTRRKWSVEESDWLKNGVALYGEGKWGKIHSAFPFKGRTAVNLKDRWRTMRNQNIV
ncbi:telomeric repeat binding factor a isoform X4 [Xyrauchen texanus]|uniref:telomeric repeat binding factor a isoform X3 n=1 Tax=Xyrauchen texanus TaxID=154827 RepID=UPI0022424236|nr:telomeric repeat binding factor a isoform X3 [Xyrauchen texanus]XP_051974201.1 telomeric repeat binding factor a isoform X4 [Xyrauchen texanus]